MVDFHWDSRDPWTIVSVSEDANTPGGGGTLQVQIHHTSNRMPICHMTTT